MKRHLIHIGTSGWSYKHWRGTFYPEGTRIKDEFRYFQERFDTVELNNTFYRLPKKETFITWKNDVKEDFVYVVKASRYITHMKKLLDPKESTADFFENAGLLGEKLGAILFQLPPFMKVNAERLENFIKMLPPQYQYVFEFRNISWYEDTVYEILKRYNCAFCIYELAGHESPIIDTANFVYVRLHGPGNKYQGSYSNEILQKWAGICKEWLKTKSVFMFFDNDERGYAAFNALTLKEMMQ